MMISHPFPFPFGIFLLLLLLMLFSIQWKDAMSLSIPPPPPPSSSTKSNAIIRCFKTNLSAINSTTKGANYNYKSNNKRQNQGKKKKLPYSSFRSNGTQTSRLIAADQIEDQLEQATALLQSELYKMKTKTELSTRESFHLQQSYESKFTSLPFPSVRDCNAALAIWGDTGDFKRALKLFGLMRKSNRLVGSYYDLSWHQQEHSTIHEEYKDHDENHDSCDTIGFWILQPPSPTLVTYSTLMSRAVALGKPTVALRLWRLMILEKQFYCNIPNASAITTNTATAVVATNVTHPTYSYATRTNLIMTGPPIVPDIKAVNILMNAFSKLGDTYAAKALMNQLVDGKVIPYDDYYYESPNSYEPLTMTSDDTPMAAVASLTQTSTLPSLRLIQVIPKMEPNLVTYNTLIDAYHREGDLDEALEVLKRMKQISHIHPDARTYTSLISTVGRRVTKSSGARDPDLAFMLFEEMISEAGVRPNGMTYSALIDVCGRCRRSDLALKGLRMMIRQKVNQSMENETNRRGDSPIGKKKLNRPKEAHQVILYNEVGAWTAAIDACGKVGRLETAIRLFHTMQKFGTKPNTVTCGCLTDCLLRSGKIDETLKVLDYMKKEGIQPSEVMYTSLITSASVLAKTENALRGELILNEFGDRVKRDESQHPSKVKGSSKSSSLVENEDEMKALDVYTALIQSLIRSTNKSFSHNHSPIKNDRNKRMTQENLVVRVFLILQEMKASGAEPDIACYNSILRACAACGDINRIRDVLRRIQSDNLVPNSTTWKEILKGASYAADSVTAEEMWNLALNFKTDAENSYSVAWKPRIDDFELLLSSYCNEAEKPTTTAENKIRLYNKMIEIYNTVESGNSDELSLYKNIDLVSVHSSRHAVNLIQKAAKYLNYQLPQILL